MRTCRALTLSTIDFCKFKIRISDLWWFHSSKRSVKNDLVTSNWKTFLSSPSQTRLFFLKLCHQIKLQLITRIIKRYKLQSEAFDRFRNKNSELHWGESKSRSATLQKDVESLFSSNKLRWNIKIIIRINSTAKMLAIVYKNDPCF